MKSLIIAAAILLSSASAMATGKLTVQVNSFEQGEAVRPMVGLTIYERLMQFKKYTVAFNSFTGAGEQPREVSEDVQWYTTKNQLDVVRGRWTVSPGVQLYFIEPYSETRSVGFVKVAYQLW
jgi:hypothetical protein